MSVYQLQIGEINCAVLQEGVVKMTAEDVIARYPNAEPDAIAAAIAAQPPSGSLNLLYLQSAGSHILVDVGFGETPGPPDMGGVLRGLTSLGLSAADIDIIHLTHFHGDHISGLVDADGATAYPNARYVTTRSEWNEWMARWKASDAARDRHRLQLISSIAERVSFVAPGEEIAPGVEVVNLEGHTLGHSGLLIESKGERLFHVVDILHQAFQLARPDWHFGLDSDGALAERVRRQTLGRCADENILTLFYHLDFPGLGRVGRDGEVFAWKPVN